MPGESFYDGLSLAEKLLKFADHHVDPLVRHISQDEAGYLKDAANALDSTDSSSRGRRTGMIVLALAAGAYAYTRRKAKERQAVGGLRGSVGQDVIVTTAGEPTGEVRGVLVSVSEQGIVVRDAQGHDEFVPMAEIRGVRDGQMRPIPTD